MINILSNLNIIKKIGSGGSSNVYIAEKAITDNIKVNVLVKELMPSVLSDRITQYKNGHYFIDDLPLYDNNIFKSYLTNFKSEQIMHAKIKEGGNPYVFDIQDIIEKNNTVYTISSYESGKMLVQKTFSDLNEIASCMLGICNCLKSMHSRSILHLDIKPDNIHISDMKIDGKPVVRLIDFNNSIEIHERLDTDKLLVTPAFSPVEVLALTQESDSNYKLGYYTDTFYLCGVLYYMLTKKCSLNYSFEKSINSDYYLNQPEVAKRLCEKIILKGLDDCCENRYQSVDELTADIERLIYLTDTDRPYIVHEYPTVDMDNRPTNEFFIMIDNSLKEHGFINIYGNDLNAINKCTLQYCMQNDNNFDCIQQVTFCKNLKTTLSSVKTGRINNKTFYSVFSLLLKTDLKTLIVLNKFETVHSKTLKRLVENQDFFKRCELETNQYIESKLKDTVNLLNSNPNLHIILITQTPILENNLPCHFNEQLTFTDKLKDEDISYSDPENRNPFVRFYMYAHNLWQAYNDGDLDVFSSQTYAFLSSFDGLDYFAYRAVQFIKKLRSNS